MKDIMTIKETVRKRNTINIKKESLSLELMKLKTLLNTGLSKTKKITKGDNKEEYSGAKIVKKVARKEKRAIKMENTSNQNKNTVEITETTKRMKNLCLFVKKGIEKNQQARVPLVAAIQIITTRNKSNIGANIHMIAKLITKNSTQAVTHEAITDL